MLTGLPLLPEKVIDSMPTWGRSGLFEVPTWSIDLLLRLSQSALNRIEFMNIVSASHSRSCMNAMAEETTSSVSPPSARSYQVPASSSRWIERSTPKKSSPGVMLLGQSWKKPGGFALKSPSTYR